MDEMRRPFRMILIFLCSCIIAIDCTLNTTQLDSKDDKIPGPWDQLVRETYEKALGGRKPKINLKKTKKPVEFNSTTPIMAETNNNNHFKLQNQQQQQHVQHQLQQQLAHHHQQQQHVQQQQQVQHQFHQDQRQQDFHQIDNNQDDFPSLPVMDHPVDITTARPSPVIYQNQPNSFFIRPHTNIFRPINGVGHLDANRAPLFPVNPFHQLLPVHFPNTASMIQTPLFTSPRIFPSRTPFFYPRFVNPSFLPIIPWTNAHQQIPNSMT